MEDFQKTSKGLSENFRKSSDHTQNFFKNYSDRIQTASNCFRLFQIVSGYFSTQIIFKLYSERMRPLKPFRTVFRHIKLVN